MHSFGSIYTAYQNIFSFENSLFETIRKDLIRS